MYAGLPHNSHSLRKPFAFDRGLMGTPVVFIVNLDIIVNQDNLRKVFLISVIGCDWLCCWRQVAIASETDFNYFNVRLAR
jgi:hypothetical protein